MASVPLNSVRSPLPLCLPETSEVCCPHLAYISVCDSLLCHLCDLEQYVPSSVVLPGLSQHDQKAIRWSDHSEGVGGAASSNPSVVRAGMVNKRLPGKKGEHLGKTDGAMRLRYLFLRRESPVSARRWGLGFEFSKKGQMRWNTQSSHHQTYMIYSCIYICTVS